MVFNFVRNRKIILTATTVDGVGVAGGCSRVDNGVKTLERSAVVAGHTPEGVGRAREDSRRDGEGGDRLHGGVG